MVWPVSQSWTDKFNPVQATDLSLAQRIEVWNDQGRHVGNLPDTDGSVKDDWVSGTRRSLALSVAPSPEVRAFLQPGVELRVYSGINYGFRQPELIPQGCFPLVDLSINERPESISLNPTDRWQWVARIDFPVPTPTTVGSTVQSQIARFIAGTGRWRLSDVQQLASSAAKVTAVKVYDTSQGGRAQSCIELAHSIGAEVFVDRTGLPVIRDRAALGTVRGWFRPGAGGRLRDATPTLSDVDVFNSVRVSSNNTDPAFTLPEVVVSITDQTHPAYPRFGVYRTFQMDSALYETAAQMRAAGQKMLTKVSRRARQVSLTAVAADVSLDASDTVVGNLPSVGADERFQIQSVTHPLTPGGTQDIALVSTRTDEDFNP